MIWLLLAGIAVIGGLIYMQSNAESRSDLSMLPPQFVVFDLETTGLKPDTCEIIEIGAILVNRDSVNHTTFQALVTPSKPIPNKITRITGITQVMIDTDGEPLGDVIPQFIDFIGDNPLVAFNAEFDMSFLRKAVAEVLPRHTLKNKVSCALKMARRAWPERSSFKLADLARDGGMAEQTHRALDDCRQAMTVYCAAATILRSAS